MCILFLISIFIFSPSNNIRAERDIILAATHTTDGNITLAQPNIINIAGIKQK